MNEIPTQVSNSTRRRNPHLYGGAQPTVALEPAKRIRQDTKPLLNKLETDFLRYISLIHPMARFRLQARRYKLGNGIWYKPDITALINDREHAWEVKGPHAFRGGLENLKVAAHAFPEVRWILAWKDGSRWMLQEVLP